ncbi:MAG: hypothetical protein KatS3mg077_0328 [Candidatus Binatia bacterium]|nr:MAG: hypothetical protein KatS3mg077_0328 [Candidatus Binatia bacterium]
MEFSEGRKSFLAHRILDLLEKEGLATVRNQRLALNEIKRVLEADHQIDEQIDAFVRRKIASLSRRVVPGSREWDVLYRQYYEEELRKRRR